MIRRVALALATLCCCASLQAQPAGTATGSAAPVAGAPSGPLATIPFKRETAESSAVPYAALATFGVLLLGVAILLVLRSRLSGPGALRPSGKRLHIVEAVSVGGSARLIVVEFDGQALLLAQSKDAVTLMWPHISGKENPHDPGLPPKLP